jgi:beta-lactam-binding protein with PASTA domain
MPGVFVSYRREDSAGHAGRLFDRLRAALGAHRIFMDITGIEAGVDFVETLETAVASCSVLLTVIGPEWLTVSDSTGRRRLDDPADFTRIEIAAALARKVRVVPVLVGGATMPQAAELPENLKPLARRQAVELRDTHWDADADALVTVLKRLLATTGSPPGAHPRSDDLDLGPRPQVAAQPPRKSARPWAKPASIVVVLGVLLLVAVAAPWVVPQLLQRNGSNSTEERARPNAVGPADSAKPASPPTAGAPEQSQGRSPQSSESSPSPSTTPALVPVPAVTGLSLTRAAQLLRGKGFTIGSRESVIARGASPFEVTAQSPAAGTRVPPGSSVALVFAKPGRTLPALTDLPLDEATAQLTALGFVTGMLTADPSSTAPPKQVLRQSPAPGSELEPGARVDLVYADPPPPVIVPNVVGGDMRSASAALQQAGLTIGSRSGTAVRDVTAGQIVKQDPPAGQRVRRGSGVTLVYATKPQLIVPNVTKMMSRDAVATLKSAGFEFSMVYQETDRLKPGVVMSQSPAAGTPISAEKPTVEMVVTRLPTLAAITVYCHPSDKAIAEGLSAFLKGYRATEYKIAAHRQIPKFSGFVDYTSAQYEAVAKSAAARSATWLLQQHGRRVELTPRLVPEASGGPSLVIWLPSGS